MYFKRTIFINLLFTLAVVGFILKSQVLAQIKNNTSYSSATSHKAFRVVLDPGHGGKDSATKANGFYEKDIVLNIAKEIKQYLVEEGFDVIMTREEDKFISLSERAAVTGDVFISLHANTVADTIGPSVRTMIKGMEIYTDKTMEGSVDVLNNSKVLAAMFKKHMSDIKGMDLRGVKQKSLAVLNKNQSSAILIELGFISNQEDLAFLTNRENYQQLAQAFTKAIIEYRNKLMH